METTLIAPPGSVLAGLCGWVLRAHLLMGSLTVAKQRALASSSSGNAKFSFKKMKQLRLLWLARNVFVSRLEEQDQELEI